MTPAPAVLPVAAELYDALEPLAWDDANQAWSLLLFVQASVLGLETPNAYITARDDLGLPEWGVLFDVDNAPEEALGYLAQFVGVTLVPGQTAAQSRARIRGTDGFSRGSLTSLVTAVQATLTGTKFVKIIERYNVDNPTADSPYYLYVATLPSETPDPVKSLAALIAQKPAGIMLRYHVSGATTDYEAIVAYHATYQVVFDTYATYGAVTPAPTFYDGMGQKYATYTAAVGAGTYDNPT